MKSIIYSKTPLVFSGCQKRRKQISILSFVILLLSTQAATWFMKTITTTTSPTTICVFAQQQPNNQTLLTTSSSTRATSTTAYSTSLPNLLTTISTTGSTTTIGCNNSAFTKVKLQYISKVTLDRFCYQVRSNQQLCTATNIDTDQPVGMTCAKECPNVSGCGGDGAMAPVSSAIKPVPAPVSVPTTPFSIRVNTRGPIPTPIAVTIPVPVPVSIPITVTVPKPVPVPIPSSVTVPVPITIAKPIVIPKKPYIQVRTSSKIVTIPRPPRPLDLLLSNITVTTDCPHTQIGLKRWSFPNAWPTGAVPSYNTDVTIPAGVKMVIDRSLFGGRFGIITIPESSELIMGGAGPIEFHIGGMNVYGKLTIGSDSCRITTPVNIILYGVRPRNVVRSVPLPAIKGINVDGGILNLHGKRYYPTWSRLAKTVLPGQNVILLQEAVNWEIGQQIILVTSSMKDSRDYNQNEVLTIQQIIPNPKNVRVGTVIVVNEQIENIHVANEYYQVEVGLLSRTITIQGSDLDSLPTDPDPGTCMDVDATKNKYSIYYNNTRPCVEKSELTGYGGHVMIQNNGTAYVEGIELYQMGQTNVLGRYPMHFHLLENNCPDCYFTDSSIHQSYYRCISIHGTHELFVSENVAYDIVGHCFYLESGVENNNTISYNLAAYIHTLGPSMIRGVGHNAPIVVQSDTLAVPADVSAAGFYITNTYNRIIGNAASGGWAGYAFPVLYTPLDVFRDDTIRPSSSLSLQIDGNTGHSTGWWWNKASPFYFGGTLTYNDDNKLEYDPGRSKVFFRQTCTANQCLVLKNNCGKCTIANQAWVRVTNSKSFLTAGIGFNSWSGRVELLGYEAHDVRLAFQAISTTGLWLDNMLAVCRTGESLDLPSANAQYLEAIGITWYDTNQKHIVTDSTFRNCGYRSDQYDQYDTSPTRGCDSNPLSGCDSSSRTFGFLTSSDIFSPQIMTATRNITFDDCGRRFGFEDDYPVDTESGRGQNWIDADGTISGFGEPTLIGSGVTRVKDWWSVDDDVFHDEQAPITFIRQNNGPQRAMAFTRILWDDSLHNQVGTTICEEAIPCPAEGYVRHAGAKFSPIANPGRVTPGMPLTAIGNVNGISGGFAWIVNFSRTAPRQVRFVDMEIAPDSVLLISIPYPKGTKFNVTASNTVCAPSNQLRCTEIFTQVSTLAAVRSGPGNNYFVDSNGVLTFRLAQTPYQNVGSLEWNLPNYSVPAFFSRDLWSLQRFERDGVLIPVRHSGSIYQIQARCPSDTSSSPLTGYCPQPVPAYDPQVCLPGFLQVAYDACCNKNDMTKCMYADGSKNF